MLSPIFATAQILRIQHPKNAVLRYEIDAKRTDTDYTGKDALPRSRSFIRIDSSYYVGWMYEGMYKHEHAADYLGYNNAAVPLLKAFNLIEKDYPKALGTRTSDLLTYIGVYKLQLDYSVIAAALVECYNNTDQPEQSYKIIRRAMRWNMQMENYLQCYNSLAWLVHRNRFYTQKKYSFLKNSIQDNERLANAYLDSNLVKIQQNDYLNNKIAPSYKLSANLGVYHYKAMLYSYDFQLDSAKKYYGLMKPYSNFSYNNYATFLSVCGDFREAESNYEMASFQDGGDKRLQEWAYYGSIINLYKSKPQAAILDLKDMIKAVGSTPGFGWYNIALARSYNYMGLVKESEQFLQKAEGFKEIHIGTTLGQSHYDFSINLVKLMQQAHTIQRTKFENKNWWYNPATLTTLAQQGSSKLMLQYLIVNQFAANPERDMVFYKLFSTESTVAWDEIWYLVKDFSTSYFIKKFKQEISTDQRPLIKKYYKLFLAKLQMEAGEYTSAQQLLYNILNTEKTDLEYEKLFVARTYEALAQCAKKRGDDREYDEALNGFYNNYPQLVPYADIKMNFRLQGMGDVDRVLLERLKDCNINWVDDGSTNAPTVVLNFENKKGEYKVSYFVRNKSGNDVVKRSSYTYTDSKKAAIQLAYYLFNINPKLAHPKQQ
jgi:hypothetical protein